MPTAIIMKLLLPLHSCWQCLSSSSCHLSSGWFQCPLNFSPCSPCDFPASSIHSVPLLPNHTFDPVVVCSLSSGLLSTKSSWVQGSQGSLWLPRARWHQGWGDRSDGSLSQTGFPRDSCTKTKLRGGWLSQDLLGTGFCHLKYGYQNTFQSLITCCLIKFHSGLRTVYEKYSK